MADGEKPSGGPIVTLGTKSNSHYQSLLPIEMFHLEFQNDEPESSITTQNKFSEMQKCKSNTVGINNSMNESRSKSYPNQEEDQIIANEISDKDKSKQRDSVESKVQKTLDVRGQEEAKICAQNEENNSIKPFTYEKNGIILVFQRISNDYIMKCPRCNIETKYIIQHMYRSTKCKIPDDNDGLKKEF